MTVLAVVSQNIGDSGPTPRAQVVLTQESSKAIVEGDLSSGFSVEVGDNKSLVTAWRDSAGMGFIRSYTVPVHKGDAGFTPRRDLFVCLFDNAATGNLATINGHAINSPYAPLSARVPRRRERRRLWKLYLRAIEREVAALHAEGYVVILGADMNRLRKWKIRGLVDCHGSGLGRVWISHSERIRCIKAWRGPKVGRGRVTHHADHVTLHIAP